MGLWQILKGEQPGPVRSFLHYRNKGQFGEFSTEFALTNHNIKGDFVVLKNIYIPVGEKTTEIDLVMLHTKGIFVFESKNYSGWIYGEEDQLNWTQSFRNGEHFQFYNPIFQNRSHIRALAEYLDQPLDSFTSCIVFSGECSLKYVPMNTDEVIIVRLPELLRLLRIRLQRARERYSVEEVREMAAVLKKRTHRRASEKRQHIYNINTKCPWCGGELVLRRGRFGQFLGCSNYPRCRYTREV